MVVLLVAAVLGSFADAKGALYHYAQATSPARVTVTDCHRRSRRVIDCRVVLYAGRGPHSRYTVREGVVRFGDRITVIGWKD